MTHTLNAAIIIILGIDHLPSLFLHVSFITSDTHTNTIRTLRTTKTITVAAIPNNKNPKKYIKNIFVDFVPQRFMTVFIKHLSVGVERKTIAKLLKNIEVTATELLGFETAMFTSGGVLLKERDDKTMKSKIVDNLFFS